MQQVRYGIVGLGFFGEKHAEVLQDIPGVKLAAVSTRRPDRLQEMAARFNVAKTYTDYNELLRDPELDAVSIVTHFNDHRDIAISALKSGKHVFLEKPMAATPSDCDAIIAAADGAKGMLMVGHICRFDPRVVLAKQALDAGRIGKIVSMHAARNLPASIGGGVLDKISPLMGDGIHDVDIMLWLTRDRITSVYAQNVRVRNYRYPDISWAMCRFAGGAVGVIETIWALPDSTPFAIDARLEIIGDKGALYIDCGNAGLTINDAQGMHKPDTVYWPDLYGRRDGALRTELEYFIRCIQTGKKPEVIKPTESKAAVVAMYAAEQSAESGEVVKLF
ncbi:MAG: Gfo/Idh/MocA family oxidoreductase [Verrucomicrobia bacterium]|nr:Gfo/Idh/MocA family oxidoreductase [Verrucomicrobiota bacterium]MCG2679171.1 Gfo/Idh/MocA family oxidoreductase [Kiritimatiellia bacterium]MBU4247905.1 Gfo/Idh/MocA family oxidoreductase [Verrucomicrobiota bacterium]MBU4291283.1 Gfo/Idh/MocA family oxidoreductase [Verrucomicrobiota bacterium]MBU4429467.1 Gfo/Idh/MocA family oxidoreductase [Verrucomicrobiota bacterium]